MRPGKCAAPSRNHQDNRSAPPESKWDYCDFIGKKNKREPSNIPPWCFDQQIDHIPSNTAVEHTFWPYSFASRAKELHSTALRFKSKALPIQENIFSPLFSHQRNHKICSPQKSKSNFQLQTMTLKIQKRYSCQVSTIKSQPQNWSFPIRKEFTSYKPNYTKQGGESKWHNYPSERCSHPVKETKGRNCKGRDCDQSE